MVNNIRFFRVKSGFTQKELGLKSGVSSNKISDYERLDDIRNITLNNAYRIAEALGVTINDLVYPLPERYVADEAHQIQHF